MKNPWATNWKKQEKVERYRFRFATLEDLAIFADLFPVQDPTLLVGKSVQPDADEVSLYAEWLAENEAEYDDFINDEELVRG
jgi:hypothetical protein